MNMDPSEILKTALMGYVNPAQRFSALDSMGDCFEWYMNRTNWSDKELAAALKTGKEMLLDGMHKENLIVCSVSSKENNDLAVAAGLKLASELSDETSVHYDYTKDMAELPEKFSVDEYRYENPVMYSQQEKCREIIIRCKKSVINNAIDTFGFNIDIEKTKAEDEVIIKLSDISPDGVKMWALEYGYGAEVISPESLRADIAKAVARLSEMYIGK